MARLARTAAALAALAVIAVPAPALAHGGDPTPAPGSHAGHDMSGHEGHDGHDMAEMATPPGPSHDHGAATPGSGGHDHDAPAPESGGHEHGSSSDPAGGGHEHEQLPATVTPEIRNLVLSGFAGVNAAVIVGAWLARRGRPDPDPRRRTPKASR